MSQLCRAMLILVLLCLLQKCTKAEYPVKCRYDSQSGTAFEPSTDGAKGRYNVEWCMSANLLDNVAKDNAAEWKLVVSYSVIRNETNCNKQRGPTKHKHSEVTESFDWHDLNCTTKICFSTQLDLIFTGCYVVENWLPVLGSKRDISTQYISSDLTRASLIDNEVKVNYVPHDDYVSIQWHLGNITATQYDMKLRRIHTISGKEEAEVSIKDNCSIVNARSNVIVCTLAGLNGTYDIYLTHYTPWKLGDFNSLAFSHYSFECVPRPSTELSTGGGSLVWACAALAAAAAAAALAAAGWRWRGAAAFRKRVLADWRQRLAEGGRPDEKECGQYTEGGGPILLLYAREAPAAGPLVAELTRLLQDAAHGQVWDLFSPRVVAMSAAAPGDWLRAALTRPDVRVVLLQTPALAALYSPRDAVSEAPLLGRRCVLRSPAPGDDLLSLALTLLATATTCTAPTPYTKYYLATVSGVETETLPHTVPFRRYVMPQDAARLLLDLGGGGGGGAPGAARDLGPLRHAARQFSSLVAARPDYLADHLLLLD